MLDADGTILDDDGFKTMEEIINSALKEINNINKTKKSSK